MILQAAPSFLPWDIDEAAERRFKTILGVLLILGIIFAIVVSLINLPEPPPRTQADLPDRLVKLVLEKKQREEVQPPPPPVVEQEPEPEPEPEKVEEIPEQPPQVANEVVTEEPPKPQGNREEAREKARKNLAVFNDLADLRTVDTGKQIDSSQLSSDTGEAQTITRDLIVNNAKSSSGGVQIAKASSNVGGPGLEGGGSTQVSSNLAAERDAQYSAAMTDGSPERPAENIEKYMDMNKSSFFAMYNRELRKAPSMQGEVIFEIEIAADGSVTNVSIVSSQLENPGLERKLMRKIRTINFTAMNVSTWKNLYRINFIPS